MMHKKKRAKEWSWQMGSSEKSEDEPACEQNLGDKSLSQRQALCVRIRTKYYNFCDA